jgi:hypothetical protein
LTAIGTNDIRPYFPYFDVHQEEHPTYAILNLLQRKAAGKIKLGLDLQGGTEFLVSLDTNHIKAVDTNAAKVRWNGSAWCRKRRKCCGAAWIAWAWPSQSSSPKGRTTL